MTDESRKGGRGALSNRSGRFESLVVEPSDDGWQRDEEGNPSPRTRIFADATRTAIVRNDSPDVPFAQSVNPYRGCEHGCVYCFARPSHAYLGLSPGLDFETKIFAKEQAPERLRAELGRRGYKPAVLALGGSTDPYQPIERGLGITRRILEVLDECEHPVAIITKSVSVLRDLDLIAAMASRRLAQVSVSLTTLDPVLARRMEPRASTPARRLQAIRELSRAGVPVAVLASPLVPGLSDHELEGLLAAAAEAGAASASYILLRLPGELEELFCEWLREHYPDRADRVLSLLRQCRGGRLYRGEFGERMRGTGAYAELLQARFQKASSRLGLDARAFDLDASRFRAPAAPRGRETGRQLSLF